MTVGMLREKVESEGTYCPAGCWCAGCLWWPCSPAGTEQHPLSRLF